MKKKFIAWANTDVKMDLIAWEIHTNNGTIMVSVLSLQLIYLILILVL
jgi:hypothetical protein